VFDADAADVDVSVKAAWAAFPAWSELCAVERSSYLFKLANAMETGLLEISFLDAVNMAKQIYPDYKSSLVSHQEELKRTKTRHCSRLLVQTIFRYFAGN
jgi:acyl-CoA reductase-like NAD-dependent aldehyde dehydrogenase